MIPTRGDHRPVPLDRAKYRGRNVVERCIGWQKGCRRVATRYENMATHGRAVVVRAIIHHCLRLLDPSNRTEVQVVVIRRDAENPQPPAVLKYHTCNTTRPISTRSTAGGPDSAVSSFPTASVGVGAEPPGRWDRSVVPSALIPPEYR